MSRRERTTALPRQRPATQRHKGQASRRFLGRDWSDSALRLAIMSVAIVLFVIVAGAFSYRVYAENVLRPRHTVLTVGADKIKLTYYTDRLFEFALANAQVPVPVLESSLLAKLEEESLTVQLATDRGIDLSDAAVTQSIADTLGVPVGGDGSPFDTRYRAELKRVGMSDANYRRLAMANLADTKLREAVSAEVGGSGEVLTLRAVASATQADSQAVFDRITGGEDMGEIATAESLDLGSRQTEGVQSAAPPLLFPDNLQAELEGKADNELFGPIQIGEQWWVFRVEARDSEGTYTTAQKETLDSLKFDEVIAAKRSSLTVTRSLSAKDADWARTHTNGDPAAVPQDSSIPTVASSAPTVGVTVTP